MTEKFKKCLWLVRTIFSHPMSFDEINEKWKRSELNIDGSSLPKKSFHNHLQTLQELFGIDIICDRKNGYKYSIGVDQINDQLSLDILHKLILRYSLMNDESMKRRIMDMDHDNSIPRFFYEMMDAISNHSIISLTQYRDISHLQKEYPNLLDYSNVTVYDKKQNYIPLGMVKASEEWYVIGKDATNHNMKIFRMTYVIEMSVTGNTKKDDDKEFSVKHFIEQFEYSVLYSISVGDDSGLFDLALKSIENHKASIELFMPQS